MKTILILIFLFFQCHISFSQIELNDSIKLEIQNEFSKRLQLDQMKDIPCYFKTCKSDSLTKIRKIRYLNNFKYILLITKKYGFPSNERIFTIKGATDNRIKTFTYLTFIHILQTEPQLIFNKEFSTMLLEEEKKGNLNIKTFYNNSFSVIKIQRLLCISEMKLTNEILTAWNIETMNEGDFQSCK